MGPTPALKSTNFAKIYTVNYLKDKTESDLK